jgi:hypothetical protein
MQVPVWIKPAVWGAVIGAIGIMIVGFSWMGWTLNSTHQRLATERADAAVATALTPFCVANYLKQPDAAKKLAVLREDGSWQQRETIEKGGFATMPGNAEPTSGVADACAITLLKTKNLTLVK